MGPSEDRHGRLRGPTWDRLGAALGDPPGKTTRAINRRTHKKEPTGAPHLMTALVGVPFWDPHCLNPFWNPT